MFGFVEGATPSQGDSAVDIGLDTHERRGGGVEMRDIGKEFKPEQAVAAQGAVLVEFDCEEVFGTEQSRDVRGLNDALRSGNDGSASVIDWSVGHVEPGDFLAIDVEDSTVVDEMTENQ